MGEFFCKESRAKAKAEKNEQPPLWSRLKSIFPSDVSQQLHQRLTQSEGNIFFRILMVIIHQLEIPSRYFPIAKTAHVAKKNWRIINKRISVWRENYARIFVLGYYLFLKLGTDIIRDKYPSIQVFSYQMEANIYLLTASLQGQGQVTPTQMSTSGPQYAFPSKSSGAAYGGLPHQVLRCFPSWNMLLNPKSVKMKK